MGLLKWDKIDILSITMGFGVRQGENLSPVLFSLSLLNRLNTIILLLLDVDDPVLMPEYPIKLQECLKY